MKTKKYINGLFLIVLITVFSLNTSNSLKTANDLGYVSLIDLVTLNEASAELNDGGSSCSGGTCDQANGNKYSTLTHGGKTTCCGVKASISGRKSS